MPIGRRGLLGLFAAAPVTIPTAVKEIAATLETELTNIATGITEGSDNDPESSMDSIYVDARGSEKSNWISPWELYRKWISDNGDIPDFKKQEIWDNIRVEHLDPDIAIKKSWSLSFKVLEQKKRNFKKALQREMDNQIGLSDTDQLRKFFGLENAPKQSLPDNCPPTVKPFRIR